MIRRGQKYGDIALKSVATGVGEKERWSSTIQIALKSITVLFTWFLLTFHLFLSKFN